MTADDGGRCNHDFRSTLLNATLTTLISINQDKGAQMHTHLPNI